MREQQVKVSSVDRDESKLEAKISQYMQKAGWMSVKLMRTSPSGMPDRLFLKCGRVVFLELKRKGKTPDPLQSFMIEKLRNQGFIAGWVDSFDDFLQWYNKELRDGTI